MEHLTSYDGTVLAYRVDGSGRPVVCLPGGPGLTPDYLGDLGGLASSRQLILAEMRGTGASAIPNDPATYRCDRLVADVEALRVLLGLDRMDLIGHSAAANLASLYAAAHPERIGRLVLATPGTFPGSMTRPGSAPRWLPFWADRPRDRKHDQARPAGVRQDRSRDQRRPAPVDP